MHNLYLSLFLSSNKIKLAGILLTRPRLISYVMLAISSISISSLLFNLSEATIYIAVGSTVLTNERQLLTRYLTQQAHFNNLPRESLQQLQQLV